MSRVVLVSLFDEWCFGLRSIQAQLKAAGKDANLVFFRAVGDVNALREVAGDGGFHVPPASVPAIEFDLLGEFLRKENPAIVGLGFTSNFAGLAFEIVRRVRPFVDSSAKFIFGGIDATMNPEDCARHADYVCIGEGEGLMLELLERLEENGDPAGIESLAYMKGGQFVRNEIRPAIKDLDSLARMDFDSDGKILIRGGELQYGALPPNSLLHATYPTMTSRGCPFSCAYCCNSVLAGVQDGAHAVRRHSVQYVIDELLIQKKRNPNLRMIEFHDDVFTIHPKWIDEFAVKYKRDIDLPFFCYTYPTVADPVMLEKLRDAGLSLCVMGLQSGSKSILEGIYNRTGDLDKISGAVDLLNRLGVKVILDLIGDNPFETEEDRRATVETLKSLPPVYSINRIGRLSLYENYPITNRALDQGLDLVYYPERHLYQAAETPEAAMWMSLMSLCQYEELDKDTLLRLSQMPALRKNPEILRKLDGALSKAAFWGESRISKDIVIEELTKQLADVQGRLRKIEGSFSHRACKRAKGALKKARSAIGGKAGSNGS